ncbi:MAG: 50S ribosomal protein L22 [Candidatus Peregrinibacteria bacterium]
MLAIVKSLRISPRKANLVAAMVKGKSASDAVSLLSRLPKKAARMLKKGIESAMANAKNNFAQREESLVIDRILVTKGPTLKRHIPISRGRAAPLLKRSSHFRIELSAR